jgi:DNA-directed RNA polymerase specialized sigma24 family protein
VRRRLGMVSFEKEVRRLRTTIKKQAHSAYLPGFEFDDIESEMTMTLWKACNTYDAGVGTSIDQWWWALWRRRAIDLRRSKACQTCSRTKPVSMEEFFEHPDLEVPADEVIPPPVSDSIEEAVWSLVAGGAQPIEIRQAIGITRHKYERIIADWHDREEIRDFLNT